MAAAAEAGVATAVAATGAVAMAAETMVVAVAAAAVAAEAAAVDVAAAGAAADEIVASRGKSMTKLETATHVFLIGLCCLAGGLLIEQRFFPPEDADSTAVSNLVGREIKLPGANWQAAPLSVVLQISTTCEFCNRSMPFYKNAHGDPAVAGGESTGNRRFARCR